MNTNNKKIIDMIEQCGGNIISEDTSGTIQARIPINQIREHEIVGRLRAGTPEKDKAKIANTLKEGEEPMYAPRAWVDLERNQIFLIDGVQRLHAMRTKNVSECTLFIDPKVDSADKAFKSGFFANASRHDFTEADIFQIISSDIPLTNKEISDVTKYNDSKIARIRKICRNEPVKKGVLKGMLTQSDAIKLIDACDDRFELISFLTETVEKHYAYAESKVKMWLVKINQEPGRYDKKEKKKSRFSYYRPNVEEWTTLIEQMKVKIDANELDSQLLDVKPFVKGKVKKGYKVIIGDREEWKERTVLKYFSQRSWEEFTEDEYKELLQNWDWIGQQIRKHYGMIAAKMEAEKFDLEHPDPSRSKLCGPPDLVKQDCSLTVGTDSEEETVASEE